jgi:hypothetical protein
MILDELGWFDFDFGGSSIKITSGYEGYNQLECRNNRIRSDANLGVDRPIIIPFDPFSRPGVNHWLDKSSLE